MYACLLSVVHADNSREGVDNESHITPEGRFQLLPEEEHMKCIHMGCELGCYRLNVMNILILFGTRSSPLKLRLLRITRQDRSCSCPIGDFCTVVWRPKKYDRKCRNEHIKQMFNFRGYPSSRVGERFFDDGAAKTMTYEHQWLRKHATQPSVRVQLLYKCLGCPLDMTCTFWPKKGRK